MFSPQEPYEKLQTYWRGNTDVGTMGVSAEKVAGLEDRLKLSFPLDFRRYLLRSAPSKDHLDKETTFWWTFAKITDVSVQREWLSTLKAQRFAMVEWEYLCFADWAINCHAWAINCSNNASRGQVVVIGDGSVVANSFAAFVDGHISGGRRNHG